MAVRALVSCLNLLAAFGVLPATAGAAAGADLAGGMPKPGWTRMGHEDAVALARSAVAYEVLDAELYSFGTGADIVFGRFLGKFKLTNVSGRGSVCVAPTTDLFIPSLQKLRSGETRSQIARGADLRIASFAPSVPACMENYANGAVVYVHGKLSATQLVEINLAFDQKLAALCKIPASATPQGLLQAAGRVYNLYPRYERSDYPDPFKIEISFAVHREIYEAEGMIDTRGVRLTECVKALVD